MHIRSAQLIYTQVQTFPTEKRSTLSPVHHTEHIQQVTACMFIPVQQLNTHLSFHIHYIEGGRLVCQSNDKTNVWDTNYQVGNCDFCSESKTPIKLIMSVTKNNNKVVRTQIIKLVNQDTNK